jgi:rhodanese-related sulfurtransferase
MPAHERAAPACAPLSAAAGPRYRMSGPTKVWPAMLAAALSVAAASVGAQGAAGALCAGAVAASAAAADCVRDHKAAGELPADLTPRQVWTLKQRLGARLLLIDVRTPDETRATGVADVTDHVVPVRLPRAGTGAAQPTLVDDAQFVDNLVAALRLSGAAPATPVAVICRTGNRSGIAAQRLRAAGFVNVSNVIGGLDGKSDAIDDDEMGWRAARLPMVKAVDVPL